MQSSYYSNTTFSDTEPYDIFIKKEEDGTETSLASYPPHPKHQDSGDVFAQNFDYVAYARQIDKTPKRESPAPFQQSHDPPGSAYWRNNCPAYSHSDIPGVSSKRTDPDEVYDAIKDLRRTITAKEEEVCNLENWVKKSDEDITALTTGLIDLKSQWELKQRTSSTSGSTADLKAKVKKSTSKSKTRRRR